MKVYKENIVREIKSADMERYLKAGWNNQEVKAEVIKLKPVGKAKAPEIKAADDILQGDE